MADEHSSTRLRIAELLKVYRERAGLTIREAGQKLGKSNQTVSAWENGRGQPDADMFLKLCEVYNVESVSVFFLERKRQSQSSNRANVNYWKRGMKPPTQPENRRSWF